MPSVWEGRVESPACFQSDRDGCLTFSERAVELVAENGMTDRRQMYSNLVNPPGQGHDSYKRALVEPLQHFNTLSGPVWDFWHPHRLT